MTEVPKPLDAALDLLVYLPVGLAVTAAEELPRVAAKGRSRVGSQVAIARVVGRFAVARGRQELEKRFSPPSPVPPAAGRPEPAGRPAPPTSRSAPTSSAASSPGSSPGSSPASGRTHANGAGREGALNGSGLDAGLPGADVVEESPSVAVSTAGRLPPPDPAAPSAGPSSSTPGAPDAPHSSPKLSPEASELAIPGYDSLSASQVVQRLAGLRRDELKAVGAYEETHRGRRTILNRIEQLRSE